MTISLDDIRSAAAALAGDLTVTPTIPSPRLSEQAGCRIHLKLECLHHTGSFKERGALNKLQSLTAAEAAQGVIAMSELVSNFEAGAIQNPQIPLSDDDNDHKNLTRLNTGFVRGLWIEDKPVAVQNAKGGWSYRLEDRWVFNNIVHFR